MKLAYSKFEEFITKNNYRCLRIYTYHDKVRFMECSKSTNTQDDIRSFIVNVPEKYVMTTTIPHKNIVKVDNVTSRQNLYLKEILTFIQDRDFDIVSISDRFICINGIHYTLYENTNEMCNESMSIIDRIESEISETTLDELSDNVDTIDGCELIFTENTHCKQPNIPVIVSEGLDTYIGVIYVSVDLNYFIKNITTLEDELNGYYDKIEDATNKYCISMYERALDASKDITTRIEKSMKEYNDELNNIQSELDKLSGMITKIDNLLVRKDKKYIDMIDKLNYTRNDIVSTMKDLSIKRIHIRDTIDEKLVTWLSIFDHITII